MDAPTLPEAIHKLAEDVLGKGGRTYLVGGGVRDHVLGRPVKDWDVEVFGIPGDDLQRMLRRHGSVNVVGRSFGVYKWRPRVGPDVGEIDVSVPRRDSKEGPGHKGIAVEGDPTMTVEEAARRRDLTINAMMWDVVDGSLTDPFHGLDDVAAGRLRAVDSTTFLEDPLRALRAVQFAARLGFSVDAALVALCRQAALDELPPERVQMEWGKLLLKGVRPSVGFALAREADILRRVFPEVAQVDADAVLDVLADGPRQSLAEEGARWALMLAGWLHAVPDAVEPTLDRLWMHTVQGYPVRVRVQGLVAAWSLPMGDDAGLRHASVVAPLRLSLAVRAAVRAEDTQAAFHRADELGILDEKPAPLLLGRHLGALGLPPGPDMGRILRAIYALQLDGEVTDLPQAEDAARRIIGDSG